METHPESPIETPEETLTENPSELSSETIVEEPGELLYDPSASTTSEAPNPKPSGALRLLGIGAVIIVLALLAVGGYFGYRSYIRTSEAHLVLQAKTALANEDPASAEQAATQALALTPASFLQQTNAALALRGEALVAQEKYAEALPDLTAVLAAGSEDPDLYTLRGQAYLAEGQSQEALADFGDSLVIDPNNAELLALRGQAYLAEGKVEDALADFSTALALVPNQPALLDTQARAALQIGELELARSAAASAGKLDENLSLPYAFRAETLYASYQFEEAITAASQSIQLENPPALAYRLRGGAYYWLYDLAKAKPDLEKALELDPQDAEAAALLAMLAAETDDAAGLKAASDLATSIAREAVPGLLAQAVYASYHYEYSQVRSLMDKAIRMSPERPELYIVRLGGYTSSKDEAAQQANIEKALSLAPELRIVRNAQAMWLLQTDVLDEAEGIGKQMAADFPAGQDGYLILSGVYGKRYELDQALETLVSGLVAAGESSSLYNRRADIYIQMQKKDEARSDYEAALNLRPNSVVALLKLGNIAADSGDTRVALERYQQALDLDSANPDVYLARASLYDEQEQRDKAAADRQQAAALDAQNRWLIAEEASRLFLDQDYGEAAKKLQALVKRYPQWPEAQMLLSRIYFAQGDANKARREVEGILELIPRHPDAHHLLGMLEMLEGKYDLALDEVDQMLAVQPRNAYAYTLQGEIYWKQGELDKAADSYAQSLEADPQMYSSYVSMAMVHITQEKNDQAVNELKDALKGEPNATAEVLLMSLENLPEGFKLYFHRDYRFAIAVPKGAEASTGESATGKFVSFTYASEGDFYIITINYYETGTSEIGDPWLTSSAFHKNLQKTMPSFGPGDLKEFKAMNTTGVKHIFRATAPYQGKDTALGGNMYFFNAEGRNMMIEFTTKRYTAPNLRGWFDQIAATFAFLP